ncbi:MAG: hypothetical protein M3O91_09720 [Chloroflexota bacterium]|nr:hypothetical protein [Chloroflexota bacterium]
MICTCGHDLQRHNLAGDCLWVVEAGADGRAVRCDCLEFFLDQPEDPASSDRIHTFLDGWRMSDEYGTEPDTTADDGASAAT